MSLKPAPIPPVPDETAKVARAAFPHGNIYLQMRDELGTLYSDEQFADLFPVRGQPAEAPWRLALITVMQYLENLSDQQAADAVRSRIDWKYALSLPLTDAGFDASLLSEFRTRLVTGNAEQRLLDLQLACFKSRGWLKARGKQRTDSTHVLAKVRALNRLLCVSQTLVYVLNLLAEVAPEWLAAQASAEWVERYGYRLEHETLPLGEEARRRQAEQVGADGWKLLTALDRAETPAWLRILPPVQILRQIWQQQYTPLEQGGHWRDDDHALPPSQMINSPYDVEARYTVKRSTRWVGYMVHLTETCDTDTPHLITHVVTTPAGVNDDRLTIPIHQALQAKGLLPAQHLVDTGYVDAELLIQSQAEYQIDLVGPTRKNYRWQAKHRTGFSSDDFHIDWQAQVATCPEGKTSLSWTPAIDRRQNPVIKIKFSTRDCQACPSRALCTSTTRHLRRTLTVRPYEQALALAQARQREQTRAFRQLYNQRAGIEGTHSQALRTMGLRRSRYLGLAKTHLQHLGTAAALNLLRATSWLSGMPRATTRMPPLVALMRGAA